MSAAVQTEFPFVCLDFAGRSTVTVSEIATVLGYSANHIFEHIEAGNLRALDSALVKSRRNIRVTVEDYRRFVLSLLTSPVQRGDFIDTLPPETLRTIRAEIDARLRTLAA